MAVPHVTTAHLYEGGKSFYEIKQDLGIKCAKHCLLCIIAHNQVGQQTCEAKGPKLNKNDIVVLLFLLNSSKN